MLTNITENWPEFLFPNYDKNWPGPYIFPRGHISSLNPGGLDCTVRSQADISAIFIFLCFVIHILKLISAISTHYTTKIVIGDNQQEVKKVFDKKKIWIFFREMSKNGPENS